MVFKEIFMNRIFFGSLILVLFCGACSAVELNKVDGNYWSNSTYLEKAKIVISMTNVLSSPDIKVLVSPEKALNLCLLTDKYYSDSSKMHNPVLTAWLDIARQSKTQGIVAN
jgi:hypothetical protein